MGRNTWGESSDSAVCTLETVGCCFSWDIAMVLRLGHSCLTPPARARVDSAPLCGRTVDVSTSPTKPSLKAVVPKGATATSHAATKRGRRWCHGVTARYDT